MALPLGRALGIIIKTGMFQVAQIVAESERTRTLVVRTVFARDDSAKLH